MPRRKKMKTLEGGQEIAAVSGIWEELQKMEPKQVKIGQLYLDPNNPRLAIIKKEPMSVERVIEEGIQIRVLEDLKKHPRIGIADLLESIVANGFSTINRVVLKPLNEDKYVVVEGNRRVAALKILTKQQKNGYRTLPENILNGILEFEALVYTGDNPNIAWIVQGVGHTPGVKQWERLPTAKFYADLEKKGINPQEIASMFGPKPREVTNLIRAYYGFRQAEEDEDYGSEIDPAEHLGFFDEIIFVKEQLKNWVGWDERERKFRNTEVLKNYLRLILARTKDGRRVIDISPTTRKTLPKLVTEPKYSELFERLLEGELTIHDCAKTTDAIEKGPKPPITIGEILEGLKATKEQISTLPIPDIKRLGRTEEEREQKREILNVMIELFETLKIQIDFLGK